MNNQEAIEILQTKYHIEGPVKIVRDELEAREIAVKALEKQMPKKIYHHPWNGIDGVPYDLCPDCKTNLCTNGFMPSKKEDYCANCGQKLDWEVENK